eukprot:INCI3195.1.p1 GENE.INCI3195.1~~INCI3195.1.p1  ORF type:complete len:399 (-),score=88.12 INCI3195.1:1041-2237(-)
MGGDGGTKSLQRKYIRSAQDKEGWKGWGVGEAGAANKADVARARVSLCALSQEALVEPVACCRLGNLYNKNAVVLALQAKAVEGTPLPTPFRHIRGLRDISTLRFTPNPAANANVNASANANAASKTAGAAAAANSNAAATTAGAKSDGSGAAARAVARAAAVATMEDLRMNGAKELPAQFMCPVMRLEFNGRNRFCAVFEGGGTAPVLSEKCLKEMTPEMLQHEVGRPFTREDCVLLCPGAEEYRKMRHALLVEFKAAKARRKLEKAQKKQKQLAGSSAAAAVEGGPETGVAVAQGGGSVIKASGGSAASETAQSEHEKKRARREKKQKKKKSRPEKAAAGVNTSLAYAGIGKQAEERVGKLKESNKVFASLFRKESNDDDQTKKANLFIRVAGRMY